MSEKFSDSPTIKAYFELYFLYSVFPHRVENSTVAKHAFFSTPAFNFHVHALSWHEVNIKAKQQVFGQKLAGEPIRFLSYYFWMTRDHARKMGLQVLRLATVGNSIPGVTTVA